MTATTTSAAGLSAHLTAACAAEFTRIREHPWLAGAAAGTLEPAQISTWAGQDLLWGQWWGPVMTAAAAAGPPRAKAAFAWLDSNMDAEVAWLRKMAGSARQFPGADRIGPGFLGYAAWARQVSGTSGDAGADHPLRALVISWACEGAYHQAWSAVRDAGPAHEWARWAARNWAGPEFAVMMADMSAGLDEAAAAADGVTGPARLADLAEIARQTLLWELECWDTVYAGRGWPA
jgi:thiaminase